MTIKTFQSEQIGGGPHSPWMWGFLAASLSTTEISLNAQATPTIPGRWVAPTPGAFLYLSGFFNLNSGSSSFTAQVVLKKNGTEVARTAAVTPTTGVASFTLTIPAGTLFAAGDVITATAVATGSVTGVNLQANLMVSSII